jgi:hypothetical protein
MAANTFRISAPVSLRAAYGIAARALAALRSHGLAAGPVSIKYWDPHQKPLNIEWTCGLDDLQRELDIRRLDEGTFAEQRRTGYPLMYLSARNEGYPRQWRITVHWPGESVPLDPSTWDTAYVRVHVAEKTPDAVIQSITDLGFTPFDGWSAMPEAVQPIHRAAAIHRIEELEGDAGCAKASPAPRGPIVGHLFTTRPWEPRKLLDDLCYAGMLGKDGWIDPSVRIVVCGDFIHTPHWDGHADRVGMLRWLAAHHPDHVQLVPGVGDWATIDEPDAGMALLRRLADEGRVRGALAIRTLEAGEAVIVPKFLVQDVAAPWSAARHDGGYVSLADALDHLIRRDRLLADGSPWHVPTEGHRYPSDVRQISTTGHSGTWDKAFASWYAEKNVDGACVYRKDAPNSSLLQLNPSHARTIKLAGREYCLGHREAADVTGALILLPHQHWGIPLALERLPDISCSEVHITPWGQKNDDSSLGLEVTIDGGDPSERHCIAPWVLKEALDQDVYEHLWTCACGVPDCASIDHEVRIQHLGSSVLWSWPRPVARCTTAASPLAWEIVRFDANRYRSVLLPALRTLRARAIKEMADAGDEGHYHDDAEGMSKWVLPDA